jgi:hypothetical protein
MITLKFPALQKALLKTKEMEATDPRKGIFVFNNNAMVFRDEFCFVINLYEYFTIEYDIVEEDELMDLKRILFYMNGKTFASDFWNELTKGAEMEIKQGILSVKTPKYSKDLHYLGNGVNIYEPLANLKAVNKQEPGAVGEIAIPFASLKTIYDCMSVDFKSDAIIFQLSSQEDAVKFTFKKRKHCFGYINVDYNAAQEGFKFESFESMVADEDFENTLTESIAPEPPNDNSDD